MKVDIKNILTLAAHTDDVEIGCGASLYKFSDANIKVIAFSLKLNVQKTLKIYFLLFSGFRD